MFVPLSYENLALREVIMPKEKGTLDNKRVADKGWVTLIIGNKGRGVITLERQRIMQKFLRNVGITQQIQWV